MSSLETYNVILGALITSGCDLNAKIGLLKLSRCSVVYLALQVWFYIKSAVKMLSVYCQRCTGCSLDKRYIEFHLLPRGGICSL